MFTGFYGFLMNGYSFVDTFKDICLGASESEVNVPKNKSEIGMYLVHGTLQVSDMEPYGTYMILGRKSIRPIH